MDLVLSNFVEQCVWREAEREVVVVVGAKLEVLRPLRRQTT